MKHYITKRRKLAAYKAAIKRFGLTVEEDSLMQAIINERGGYYYEVVSTDKVAMCYFNNEEMTYTFTTIYLYSGKSYRWTP